jgi:4-hydroxythreonine-4-phosphate dehydrogenase
MRLGGGWFAVTIQTIGKNRQPVPESCRTSMNERPRLLITMGDVAGIGPEIIAKAWPSLNALCRPVVVGDPDWLRRALEQVKSSATVREIQDILPGFESHERRAEPEPRKIPCLRASDQDLSNVEPGRVSAAAGRAAYDFLCAAIAHTLAGAADGIVTAPLHKEGLRAAGLPYPGHTEILAERTGTRQFAMMLYCNSLSGAAQTLGVIHVTLHMALREVFQHLNRDAVLEKIQLLEEALAKLLGRRPSLGVAGLNPHASDGGLFGDEEASIIQPAVENAQKEGITVSGPWPSDTLFVRAVAGEFDGLVVMYHDQGHIALKLLAGRRAVNISAGLPIVRTSVAHGTAYDIAGKGLADPSSLIEATRVAAQLAKKTSDE